MSGNQLDNIQILDASSPFLNRSIEATDNLQISASVEILNDLTVTGNLVATSVTSIQTEEMRVNDNHIFLNDGYTLDAPQTGGIVVNYDPDPTGAQTTVAATGFAPGVGAGANPTVITVGSGTFSANDFIMITGAANEANNGLYEVLDHVGTALRIRGVGTTSTVEDFTEDQFVLDTTVAGTITRIALAVLRTDTSGDWEAAKGSNHGGTGLVFTTFAMGGTTTLQDAYDNDVDGSDVLITTNATDGALVVAGTEKLQVTATGGLDVDTLADFDVSSFDVLSSAAFSIDGATASNVSTTSSNLTLSTITSGTLFLTSAGLLDIDAAANMDVDVTGSYDLLATGAGSLDFTGASNVTTDSGNMTLSTTTSGDVVLSSAGDIDGDAVNILLDATAGFSVDGAAASNVSTTGADLQISTITSGELDLTSAGLLDVNAAANMDVDVTGTYDLLATGTGSMDFTGNSNLSVDSGDLLLQTTTSGELDLTSAGLLDINAAANMDIDVTGTYDMLSTGTFSIDGTGASNVTADSGNLTLATTTSGSVLISSFGASTYTIPNTGTAAWTLKNATTDFLKANADTGCVEISCLVGNSAVELVTDVALAEGDLVHLKTNGAVALADADTGSLIDGIVAGVSTGTFGISATAQLVAASGSVVPVKFASAPAAGDNGKMVFLSTTAGQATLTAPSGGSNKVVYKIGILQGGDGADTTPNVLLQPQFISRGAGVS